jgi:DNA-binding transcriptional MerR regulator
MSWSASELGALAGTSRRAVRHYQELGLLTEPHRSSNGYQHYDVTHLVRLLRIRRLSELGLPLALIRDLGESDAHPGQALRSLQTELDASIDRLQRLRAELDAILTRAAPVDLPIDLADVTRDLSEADRSLTVVLSRVLAPQGVQAWKELLGSYRSAPAVAAFDALETDASASEREEVAADLVEHIEDLAGELPDAFAPLLDDLAWHPRTLQSVDVAVSQLYNDAQRDVLRQASAELVSTMRAVMDRR